MSGLGVRGGATSPWTSPAYAFAEKYMLSAVSVKFRFLKLTCDINLVPDGHGNILNIELDMAD